MQNSTTLNLSDITSKFQTVAISVISLLTNNISSTMWDTFMRDFLIKFHMRSNDLLIFVIKWKLNINGMQSPFRYFTLYRKLSIPSQKIYILAITTHHFRALYIASVAPTTQVHTSAVLLSIGRNYKFRRWGGFCWHNTVPVFLISQVLYIHIHTYYDVLPKSRNIGVEMYGYS
jgi:hypothetical protein